MKDYTLYIGLDVCGWTGKTNSYAVARPTGVPQELELICVGRAELRTRTIASIAANDRLRPEVILGLIVPELASKADLVNARLCVGIDAPFGLPVTARTHGRVPVGCRSTPAPPGTQESWLWRKSEVQLRQAGLKGIQSSISDPIGSQATKTQALVGVMFRAGACVWPFEPHKSAKVVAVEVFPGATLWATGRPSNYKDESALGEYTRRKIALSLLRDRAGDGGVLPVGPTLVRIMADRGVQPSFSKESAPILVCAAAEHGADNLDAVICAMTAYCADQEWCVRPDGGDPSEGWIAVPRTALWREGSPMNKKKARDLIVALHQDHLIESVDCVKALTRHIVIDCFEDEGRESRRRMERDTGDEGAPGKSGRRPPKPGKAESANFIRDLVKDSSSPVHGVLRQLIGEDGKGPCSKSCLEFIATAVSRAAEGCLKKDDGDVQRIIEVIGCKDEGT